ncbi:MAG: glycoside hydrolase family 5 protein [Treponema sp.]|nr:glycoside hydrolase family 5 protein [Treponema sp.]
MTTKNAVDKFTTYCHQYASLIAVCITLCTAANAPLFAQAPVNQVVSSPVQQYGQLSVEGRFLKSESGETVQLRGFSSHGLVWYPRYCNANALKTTKSYGANVFRAAMYLTQEGGYIYNETESKNYLYMAVENAISQDMYVIVDWHVMRDKNPLKHKNKAIDFFTEITSRYPNCKNILYEICNEPNGRTSWKDVYEYAEYIIPIIRKNSPKAVIIVGTPDYCRDLSGPLKKPLPYANIMYSYHHYINISEQNEFSPGDLKKALDKKLPIFVTEWGISYGKLDDTKITASHDSRLNFNETRKFIDYLKTNNIGWCVWSLSNKAESHSVILSTCNKLSDWEDSDMTPWGRFIVRALKKYIQE